ncbi:TPA: aromatic/alkene/methane monooxygenase hydroxylase/oxygenase subunit alpha [Burkholderia cenocepacia]|jgi:phenol hydroxylase P3 protein|uniref:aromatic/alkene/methane monooxygenase hydroxylase/oxygenase subunit alpha n=1 Tax=Burkholderia cenocepacia TaxID=95486 RepID=UPI0004F893BF|nr:aromatic/alkene/methane monooxygenase hydroxylase/oxygenase subunit alpha [Burkholderia cenocepacia]AIO45762.1 phenol hydroxylase component phN [Burkholderia cepacia]KGC01350.1 phenol hydroxylase component phN [Burkholderia cepacia]MBJ9693757.1 aromatic/alkene/methane monooxygenase hydroxylase/oxygenase subunit alpha [Burkholderia cenocepacia]MBN3530866.1 aromatic/alkene/methane monooxygenase hydroxylase/oxygenase subunit alpha [Burkholderia cenocepacia]MBO1855458.1 aromatic/alkene/methane 
MDTPTLKKKLGLKDRYAAMTRGLGWETTYQPMDKVFPYDRYEGIKIHDWDKWVDPFRLTMDAYWKYQGEKEKKLYAVIDAFTQNNAFLGVTDARYINALKLFIQGVTPLEYLAHRGFAHVGRHFTGEGARIACQMQSIDELRHYQTETHAMSTYNKFFNGFHHSNHWFDRVWYLSVPKSFFEDAYSSGPFEFLTAVSFSFEYVLTNLLFVPFMSGAAYNGDMSTVTFGFSAQSDESRHMTLGIECIKFLLEQDPDNVPIVQRWIDKWFWRGYRLLTLVAMMMDYMQPKRVMSWRESWEMYAEQNGGALFKDLARYGIREPKGWQDACEGKDHISHQAWSTFYGFNAASAFHTWVPAEDEMAWLSAKYPDSFDRYYRTRFDYWGEQAKAGNRFYMKTLPMLCQTCQIPMLFTEPGNPRKIGARESDYLGNRFHFCSDHCKEIFDHEPQKYVQAWLPVHQIYQGNCFPPDADPSAEGFDPLAAVLDYYAVGMGRDNLDFEGSEDQKNFAAWRGQATSN